MLIRYRSLLSKQRERVAAVNDEFEEDLLRVSFLVPRSQGESTALINDLSIAKCWG